MWILSSRGLTWNIKSYFLWKINEKIFMNVHCSSRDWRFKVKVNWCTFWRSNSSHSIPAANFTGRIAPYPPLRNSWLFPHFTVTFNDFSYHFSALEVDFTLYFNNANWITWKLVHTPLRKKISFLEEWICFSCNSSTQRGGRNKKFSFLEEWIC